MRQTLSATNDYLHRHLFSGLISSVFFKDQHDVQQPEDIQFTAADAETTREYSQVNLNQRI